MGAGVGAGETLMTGIRVPRVFSGSLVEDVETCSWRTTLLQGGFLQNFSPLTTGSVRASPLARFCTGHTSSVLIALPNGFRVFLVQQRGC